MTARTTAPAPDPIAIRRAEAELARSLRVLLMLFPDPEFKGTSPEVNIERCAPIATGHRVTLYRSDLTRSTEDVLTILLHKAVHLANAFGWNRDCNWRSRHNCFFRKLAEEVGFDVSWVNARFAWAKTTPSPRLRQIFGDLALAEQFLEPFRYPDPFTSPIKWHCGQYHLPLPDEIGAVLKTPTPNRRRWRLPVRGMTVNRLYRGYRTVPMLRLTGHWLTDLGFPTASRVRLDARYGELRIQAREPGPGQEEKP